MWRQYKVADCSNRQHANKTLSSNLIGKESHPWQWQRSFCLQAILTIPLGVWFLPTQLPTPKSTAKALMTLRLQQSSLTERGGCGRVTSETRLTRRMFSHQ